MIQSVYALDPGSARNVSDCAKEIALELRA